MLIFADTNWLKVFFSGKFAKAKFYNWIIKTYVAGIVKKRLPDLEGWLVPFGTTQDRISQLNYNLVDGIVKKRLPDLEGWLVQFGTTQDRISQLNYNLVDGIVKKRLPDLEGWLVPFGTTRKRNFTIE